MVPARIDDPAHDREAGSRDATLDTTRIDDTRIAAVRALVAPAVLLEEQPVTPEIEQLVERTRGEIADVLQGRDDRLVVDPDRDDVDAIAASWPTYPRWYQDGMRKKHARLGRM